MVFGKKGKKGMMGFREFDDIMAVGGKNPSQKDLFNVGKNAPKIPTDGLDMATSKKRTLRKLGMKEGNNLERIAKRGI